MILLLIIKNVTLPLTCGHYLDDHKLLTSPSFGPKFELNMKKEFILFFISIILKLCNFFSDSKTKKQSNF